LGKARKLFFGELDFLRSREDKNLATQVENILEFESVFLNFGSVQALSDVSFQAKKNEVLGIIGPNGAGKTCVLNCINGFYRPQKGNIIYKGKKIDGLTPNKIAERGVARVFQNVELYTGMTTLNNLMAARHARMRGNVFWGALYFGKALKEEMAHRKAVEELIDFLDLQPIRNKVVGTLSYGLRKRVELGRALAMEPELLLLDEPMAGMTVEEKEDMTRFVMDVHELQGTSMIIIEHDMGVVMDIVDRVVVIDFGVKIAEGTPEEIAKNPEVIKCYLGKEG
jgi:branched-chain amino acid transport system ATP-binding protein